MTAAFMLALLVAGVVFAVRRARREHADRVNAEHEKWAASLNDGSAAEGVEFRPLTRQQQQFAAAYASVHRPTEDDRLATAGSTGAGRS